jgi:dephospho-CoA kinase
MIHVGVTGGIGSGKSTVAKMLGGLGAVVLDADQIVRELMGPGGEGAAQVKEAFGDAYLAADGSTDRKALAALIFADQASRKRLESLIHPLVIALRRKKLDAVRLKEGKDAVVVSEASLIFEAGTRGEFDYVILVTAPEEIRKQRLLSAGWDPGEVDRRMASQWPDSAKAPLADWIVDNGGRSEETQRQVQSLWPALKEKARAGG